VWITSHAMASKLQCDDARWPLVILTAPVQWGADSVVRYIEETTNQAQRGYPLALILDLTQSALPAAEARRRLTAHRRWLYQQLGNRLLSECLVVRSRAHQECFLLLTEGGIADPRQLVSGHLEAAIGFSVALLAERGLTVLTTPPRPSGVSFKPPRKAFASQPEPELEAEPVAPLRRFS
jgi:hypothetical protein